MIRSLKQSISKFSLIGGIKLGWILGIDTGGTYTDGVIIDPASKEIIAKSKALTTLEDLTIGIRNCLDSLGATTFNTLSMVSLSTTLATNTIVEGRGCEVGLIQVGRKPNGILPTEHVILTPGGHDIKGWPMEDLDLDLLRGQLVSFKGKVEAVAVSGYLSIRNPEHELQVRDLVQEVLHIPVVCAHELTTTLGLYERTVTAVLNARLLPVIAELIQSVKKVLAEQEINAPVMIVKGDGSLMSEQVAREKPIETILSGPASSIIGGTYLTPTDNALIVDIGGTTTDIALVEEGIPRLTQEGAVVGGWFTRVHSAEINTYGLGGDSQIQMTKDRKLLVGPRRAFPLCYVASQYPSIEKELLQYASKIVNTSVIQSVDCFVAFPRQNRETLLPSEIKLLDLLGSGPHTFYYLAEKMEVDPILFSSESYLQKLINLGLIARVTLTPTDILHVRGTYTAWNDQVAKLGCELLAQKMGKSLEDFLNAASERIIDNLCFTIIQSFQMYEGNSSNPLSNEQVMYYLNKALHPQENGLLHCRLNAGMPIIGIGAPAHAWLPQVAKLLNTPLLVPEHAEVANAVGAAVGKIVVNVETMIRPDSNFGGFVVYSLKGHKHLDEFEEAVDYAENEARKHASREAEKTGAQHYELIVKREDINAEINYSPDHPLFIECKIKVTAIGTSTWS